MLDLDGLVALLGGLGLGRGDGLLGVFGQFVQVHEKKLSGKRSPRARGLLAGEPARSAKSPPAGRDDGLGQGRLRGWVSSQANQPEGDAAKA